MTRIALVTYQGSPELTASDRLLIDPLAKRGIQAVGVPWNDPAVDWTEFEAAVLRSTWDYHHQIEVFRQWLDRVEAAGLRLFNPYPLVRWNMDKIYLRDLQGVPHIPTIWGTEDSELARDLALIMDTQGWDQVIVKPRYGASGDGAHIISRSEADHQPVPLLNHFIQPIMPQVLDGEYSVIFLGGEYAYTVLKRPAAGKIFVQKEHGGSEEVIAPPGSLVAQAEDILTTAAQHPRLPALCPR